MNINRKKTIALFGVSLIVFIFDKIQHTMKKAIIRIKIEDITFRFDLIYSGNSFKLYDNERVVMEGIFGPNSLLKSIEVVEYLKQPLLIKIKKIMGVN